MAKVLLGHHNIENYIDRDTKSIQVDGGVIVPPGMKDYLQTEGISLLFTKSGEVQENLEQKRREVEKEKKEPGNYPSEEVVEALSARIVSILKSEHQMTDEETIKRICLQVINQVNQ